MKATSKSLAGLFAAAVIGLVGVEPAHAGPFIATGTVGGNPVAGSAAFAVSDGQIQITLTNLLTPDQIISAGQTLSDVKFTLSNSPGDVTSASATGTEAFIDANGNVSSSTPNASIPRWVGAGPPPPGGQGTFTITGNTIYLSTIGGGQPSDLILPSGTSFPNGDSSITGDQFNPFVVGPLVITLGLSNVTSSTTVSDVFLSFGTGPDQEFPATIPEPSTLAMTAVAALGFAGHYLRRRLAR